MKISELIVGQKCDITLVVKSATARETRAKKPYLALELYDGISIINGNYWDWTSGNIPPVNAILDVSAQVSEWQGTKQLNIKSLSTNTAKHISEFVPKSDLDVSTAYKDAYALASDITDDTLRTLTLDILEELREAWLVAPGAVSVHHAYTGGTLVHSLEVARLAAAMAKEIPEANADLCIAGALLHDLGKLFTYRVNGVNIEMTSDGKMYEHLFIGAEFIGNFAENHLDTDNPLVYAKIRLLRHIILAHHGQLEYGSPVNPCCIEAYIVHSADELSANVECIRQASKKAGDQLWTEKVYVLNNKPQLNMNYVKRAMSGEEETM